MGGRLALDLLEEQLPELGHQGAQALGELGAVAHRHGAVDAVVAQIEAHVDLREAHVVDRTGEDAVLVGARGELAHTVLDAETLFHFV